MCYFVNKQISNMLTIKQYKVIISIVLHNLPVTLNATTIFKTLYNLPIK